MRERSASRVPGTGTFAALARELVWLRNHNFRAARDEARAELLLFAEGSLVLLCLERFLRMILKSQAKDGMTLPNLLELATSERIALLKIQGPNRTEAIRQITSVRNTLQHANYEQAARESGCASAPLVDVWSRISISIKRTK